MTDRQRGDSISEFSKKIEKHLHNGFTFLILNPDFSRFSHSLTLSEDFPGQPYKPLPDSQKKFILHFGQLKLLLGEIRFLTKFGHLCKTVVYVGAAPGSHLLYLSKLFPEHKFILWDPSIFDPRVKKKFECHNSYFKDSDAEVLKKRFSSSGVLFISDIRTASHKTMKREEVEEFVRKDNEFQKNWCRVLRPKRAMLKFRLPFVYSEKDHFSSYLDGDIWLQPFSTRMGTETRLIPKPGPNSDYAEEKKYDNKKYESQLFFVNTKLRASLVFNPYADLSINFHHLWDFWGFAVILQQYIFAVNKERERRSENKPHLRYSLDQRTMEKLKPKISAMVIQITEFLGIDLDYFSFQKLLHKKTYRSLNHKTFFQEGTTTFVTL